MRAEYVCNTHWEVVVRKINFSRHEQVHVANIVPTAQSLQDSGKVKVLE